MKRALSLLLVIVMVFNLVTMTVFADGVPTISFETTFTDEKTVGDTFTVTASLAENPGIYNMTLSLKWNDSVVKFNGFETEFDEDTEENVLKSDVFSALPSLAVNHEEGIIAGSRTGSTNTTKNGDLFTAIFEIVGSGDLEIGLKNTDRTEFEMVNVDQGVITPNIDYSAISGLSVAAPSTGGATIPEGAPFTAITTDAGDVIAIEEMDAVDYTGYSTYYGIPYYHIQIPEAATEVYVTHPASVDPFLDSAYGYARGYYAETEGWTGGGMDFNYEGNTITLPLTATVSDWMTNSEVEVCCIADEAGNVSHAVAVEKNNYVPICFFSFEYGTAPEGGGNNQGGGGTTEPTTYTITVNQTTGGTVTVYDENMNEITQAAEGDYIFVEYTADTGYSFKQLYVNGDPVDVGMTNGFYTMPAKAITVSAEFEANHTCVYDQEVVAEKYLKSEATCQSGAVYYKSCTCGEFDNSETAATFTSGATVDCVYENGKCKWCGAAAPSGYTFATSADVSTQNGGTAVVKVKITGHSNPDVTKYNAYDITLTFDSDKLEYVGYDGAVKSDNGSVTVSGNTIHIVGCGADKDFGTEIVALTFKTKAEGAADVTVTKVQVSDKKEAVKDNAPEATPKHDEDDSTADETPSESIIVVPYSVTKPKDGFVSGADSVLHGEDYTFSYTDTTNYTYSDLTVKVGGTAVTPTEENGVYTITNVTGAIEITATQTPNSYDVTKPENVSGPDKATYGTDYVFTVTPSNEDMAIDTVAVKYADGSEVSYTINENGEYVIAGTDITGAFTITVTEKEKMTTITFSGIGEDEIEGGKLTVAAEIGKAFTFKLIKKEGFDYTVKVGETELTESNGQYTIPANLVVAGGVTVTIKKVDNTTATVDVTEYINLDGKTMFLVTAKWDNKVLAYGEGNTMYWSDKYTVTGETEAGAYCWLVVSSEGMNTVDAVKAAAEAAIVEAAAGASATKIRYDYDVNGTTKVDVNDAQLAYDMYNASYMEFTDNLPMQKFLEADMSTDGKLDVNDVAAIISYIVSGAADTNSTVNE